MAASERKSPKQEFLSVGSPKSKETDEKSQLFKPKLCSSVNCSLLPFKAYYYFFYGAIGCLWPFLAIYFRQLWLSPVQAGLLVGLVRVAQSFANPFWGLLADKFYVKKVVLFIGLCGWLFSLTSVLFVPPGKKPDSCYEDSTSLTKRHALDRYHNLRHVLEVKFNVKFNKTYNHSRVSYANDRKNENYPEMTSFQTNQSRIFSMNVSRDLLVTRRILFNASGQSSRQQNVIQDVKDGSPRNGSWLISTRRDIPNTTWRTFSYLCTIIIIGNIFSAPAQTMANTATLAKLGANTHKYGAQRCYGAVGYGVSAFVVGMLVSVNHDSSLACKGRGDINYTPCFYAFAGHMISAIVAATFFKFPDKNCDKTHQAPLRFHSVIRQIDLFMLFAFLTALLAGFNMGFIQTFLFWHLQSLGGTQILFSLITGLNGVGEVSGFLLSVILIENCGHFKVLALGLFAYAVRLTVYGFVHNPWYVLSVEILKGLTKSAVWASLMSYMGLQQSLSVTLQSIVHMLYWGLGNGGGGILGGILMEKFGARVIFLGLAVISVVDMIVLLLITLFNCGTKRTEDAYALVKGSEEEEE